MGNVTNTHFVYPFLNNHQSNQSKKMKQLILITAMLLAMTAKLVAENDGAALKKKSKLNSLLIKDHHQSKNEAINQKN